MNMKAYVVHAPNQGSFDDVPVPEIKENQVLIAIKYIGICGTDFVIYDGSSSFVKNGQIEYPIRMGHEWSGVVEKVGKNVTKFQKGDRVIGDNFVACEECEPCLRRDYNNCTNRYNVGTIHAWDGGFADYMVMPEHHVYKVADHVSLKVAALGEPLSVSYGAIKKLDIVPESTVAVFGTGSIGMSAAALALHKGSKNVYMIGRNAYKLEIAKKVGVTGVINVKEENLKEAARCATGGAGFQYVVECSGVPENIQNAIDIIGQKGKLMLVGFYEQEINGIDIDKAVSKEISITGIMGEYGNLEAVNKIITEHDLHLESIITEDVNFNNINQAFLDRTKKKDKCIKTMVSME